jgi:hypothetical protein
LRRFRLVLTLGFIALVRLAAGCGSDPYPAEPCESGIPDFEVLIQAAVGPLPRDLLVRVEYGGGEEEYLLADPGTPVVMFCDHADRQRNTLTDGGLGGSGGEGGGGGQGGSTKFRGVEALLCKIWSFGSARIEVETMAYPDTMPLELTRKQNTCTVKADLELSLPDGGLGPRRSAYP